MARKGLPPAVAEGIRKRLRAFYFGARTAKATTRASSHSDLARKLEAPVQTVHSWSPSTVTKRRTKAPTVPDLRHIIRMAERHRLNPTWLLLGTGLPLLDATMPEKEIAPLVRRNLVAHLRSLGIPRVLTAQLPNGRTLWRSIVRGWAQVLEGVRERAEARRRFKEEVRRRSREWSRKP